MVHSRLLLKEKTLHRTLTRLRVDEDFCLICEVDFTTKALTP